jgi:predicted nucleic acid-binding protein
MSRVRVVPDTNVIVASRKSANPGSPNRELIDRWLAGEYALLYSRDTALQDAEKLIELGIPPTDIQEFFAALRTLGELVVVRHFHFRHYPVDADDIAFLLCALNGAASHLVTYDDDLLALYHAYSDQLTVCAPLEFLRQFKSRTPGEGI